MRSFRQATVVLALGWAAFASWAAEPTTRPVAERQLRVALYADEGSKTGGDNVEKCLAVEPDGFVTRRVTAAEIRAGVLKDFDVFVAGGGRGSKTAEALQPEGREMVKKFVADGGGYVGICAGAYLASSDYPWSLHILNAKVLDRKHWNRGSGDVRLTMSEAGRKTLGVDSGEIECNYNQGPLLAPDEKPDLPAYVPLATFATEIAKNGAPSGVMIGTTAIAKSTFGGGRVVAISPHPEKSMTHNEIIRRAIAWVGKADGQAVPATQPAGQ